MKKLFGICITIMVLTGMSYAADFAPTPMIISAPETVMYDFDGSEFMIFIPEKPKENNEK